MNLELVRAYLTVNGERISADKIAKALKETEDTLKEQVTAELLNNGVAAVTVDGRVIGIGQDVYPAMREEVERGALVRAFQEAGLDQYLTINHQSMRKYVGDIADAVAAECREKESVMTEDDVVAAFPGPLQTVLKVSFKHNLSNRKSGKA